MSVASWPVCRCSRKWGTPSTWDNVGTATTQQLWESASSVRIAAGCATVGGTASCTAHHPVRRGVESAISADRRSLSGHVQIQNSTRVCHTYALRNHLAWKLILDKNTANAAVTNSHLRVREGRVVARPRTELHRDTAPVTAPVTAWSKCWRRWESLGLDHPAA